MIDSGTIKVGAMKATFLSVLIFSIITFAMGIFGEVVVRQIDGYALMSPTLTRSLTFKRKQLPEVDTNSTGKFTLKDFVTGYQSSTSVDISWIHIDPPLRTKMKPPQNFVERSSVANGDPTVNYLWNDYLVKEVLKGRKDWGNFRFAETTFPDPIFVYPASWKTMFPRYRYPTNVTLPSGIQTNQFGWRGGSIDLQKPKKTIRIACVGASTTVSGHGYNYSYPEFLEHWLNLWKDQKGYNFKFEVINAGREGINSTDIAAVVKYEILPLDVDYVVYYEGSNQFNTPSMVKYPSDVIFGNPPAGLIPNMAEIQSTDRTWLDRMADYSAIIARVRTVVESQTLSGVEPHKPSQTFFLPDGVDELSPDVKKLGAALNLGIILSDLDEIKMEVEKTGAKMIMTTFKWLVFDGMVLDPVKYRGLYIYLNRIFWPMSYKNMERMALFQNRVFKKWSQENGLDLVEVAEKIPQEPDLFIDAIHNTQLGIKVRGWTVFEGLIPILERDIKEGILPRLPKNRLHQHPFLKESYAINKSDQLRIP